MEILISIFQTGRSFTPPPAYTEVSVWMHMSICTLVRMLLLLKFYCYHGLFWESHGNCRFVLSRTYSIKFNSRIKKCLVVKKYIFYYVQKKLAVNRLNLTCRWRKMDFRILWEPDGSILWESRLEQRQTTFIVSPQPQTLPKMNPSVIKWRNEWHFGCVFKTYVCGHFRHKRAIESRLEGHSHR